MEMLLRLSASKGDSQAQVILEERELITRQTGFEESKYHQQYNAFKDGLEVEETNVVYVPREGESESKYIQRLKSKHFVTLIERVRLEPNKVETLHKGIVQKVADWERDFYQWLIGENNLKDLSNEEIMNLDIEDFLEKSVVSFLKGNFDATKMEALESEMQQIKEQSIQDETFMKAPNGKPTNLNERQWLQVRTKAFNDWLEDWRLEQNLLFLYNEKGRIDYKKLGDVARTDRGKEIAFPELNEQKERTGVEGDGVAIESSIILRGDRRANQEKYSGEKTSGVAKRQEMLLKQYAMDRGLWLNEEDIATKALRRLPNGEESHVYLDQDRMHVFKVMNYLVMSETPEEYLVDRIALNDYLFPDAKLKVVGFTENENGFAFVVKQPFIQGEMLYNENSIVLPPEKKKKLDLYMKEHYDMESLGTTYYNQDYIIDDVHGGNVLVKGDGEFRFIDIVPSLNTELDDLDGVRCSVASSSKE